MKIRIGIILIAFVVIVSFSGCGNRKVKEFKNYVDEFCESYNTRVVSDDPLYKDIGLKRCVALLSNMAELYEDSKLKKAYNEYLKENLTYSVIDPILEYDESEGRNRIIRSQLIEYLKTI